MVVTVAVSDKDPLKRLQILSARPTHPDREIARGKCGRYLLGRYRDWPSVQKGTVLPARVFRISPLTSTSGGASGMVVGLGSS